MSLQETMLAKKKKQAQQLLSQDRLPEAKVAYQKILKRFPDDANGWYMLGTIEGRLGDLSAAEKAMCRSLQADAELAEGWFGLGQVLMLQGNPDDARQTFLKALSINPKHVDANVALGRVYVTMQMFLQALEPLETALQMNPDQAQVSYLYGDALAGCGRTVQAFEIFKKLLQRYPNDIELICKVGGLYARFSDLEQARGCLEKALKIDPTHIGARLSYLSILRLQKDYERALPEIDALFESEAKNIQVAILYSYLCHLNGSCEKVVSRLEGFLNISGLAKTDEVNVCFELGRLCDAQADYDRAFGFFKRGNELKSGRYNAEESSAMVSAWVDGYGREIMQDKQLSTKREHGRPLFIVGVPRSGTTLVEQILSSHPEVYGAGELTDMVDILRDYRGNYFQNNNIRHEVENFLPADLEVMANRYRDRLDELSNGERFVVDKLPGNFIRLGLIAVLFPDAKIINCMRNPIDTCLSCYFNDFDGVHSYLYDLNDLVSFYKNYQRLMKHWHEALPISILDVHYEDVVADQEGESRRMFEFLELEWDEACLNFYDSERAVVTSSHGQVQKPIYNSSVSRWRNYEKHIEPLIKGLSE